MSTYETTADDVEVGDILIDADHVAHYVDDIETVESFGPRNARFGLRFLLRNVDDNSERTESYETGEVVTLDAQDAEGESFESALWRASGPNPDYRPRTVTEALAPLLDHNVRADSLDRGDVFRAGPTSKYRGPTFKVEGIAPTGPDQRDGGMMVLVVTTTGNVMGFHADEAVELVERAPMSAEEAALRYGGVLYLDEPTGYNPTTLIAYTDADGDLLTVAHDPLDNEPEDLWIGINMTEGRSAAVRIPWATLRAALAERPNLRPKDTPMPGKPRGPEAVYPVNMLPGDTRPGYGKVAEAELVEAPEYTEWRHAVWQGDTVLGFAEWVAFVTQVAEAEAIDEANERYWAAQPRPIDYDEGTD